MQFVMFVNICKYLYKICFKSFYCFFIFISLHCFFFPLDKQQEKQQHNDDYPKTLDSGVILKDDITALKGSSPALTCAIPEATRPQLKWYKNGNLISLSNKYLPRGEQLVLNNVDEESSGEYTCVIATQSGVTQIIFRVKIEGKFNFLSLLFLQNKFT